MRVGFFTVVRRDPQHFLHAEGLVASVRAAMPGVETVQFTDAASPRVPGVDHVQRLPHGPMLERRLEHYSHCEGDWLLVDTDVQLLRDVSDICTTDQRFDIALTDRHWPDIPQGDDVMHTMPFNTGVCFSRSSFFWQDVLTTWRAYTADRRDWLSEQRAVYDVVRTGAYRIRILPGQVYNYPPRAADDPMTNVAIAHFKGSRKSWLTARILQQSPELAPV